ncbi:SRPBCC domain-containing protein [Dactylosporangium sp. NPDC048998]|uniref:SRPBCC domain-containing protein n=1 Tax=Dactylosporangium sp. NPDC048998 TaxID=3363976 RepID=UPI0037141797
MSDELGVTGFELDGEAGVRITRVVAAPRDLVFDVHTSPRHLPNWMVGPPGWTMPVCEIDLRPGGAYRYVWRAADGAEMTIAGTFQEVEPPGRLVSTEAWSGDWPATHNTVTFTDLGGRTRITTRIRYASPAARDAAVHSGMREGMDAGYAGLDAYLAEQAGGAFTMRLELVPVPVKDVDAALAFYAGRLGFHLDHDVQPGDGARVTQLTPPGSACSIVLYKDLPGLDLPPGTLRGLHLVVDDVRRARAALLARGVDAGEVQDLGGILYVPFADPDGNTWLLQEIPLGSGRPADDGIDRTVTG